MFASAPVAALSGHDEAAAGLQENLGLREDVLALVGGLPRLLEGHVHGAEQRDRHDGISETVGVLEVRTNALQQIYPLLFAGDIYSVCCLKVKKS